MRFPPPILFIAGFLAGMWLDASAVELTLFGPSGSPRAAQIGGLVVVVLGVSIAAWGAITFRRALTPIVTISPATTLVTQGPYRYTRNPMYVGLTLAYLGLALALNTGWPLVLLPVVLFALWALVVRREERHLVEKFGDEYSAYKSRVRRWL